MSHRGIRTQSTGVLSAVRGRDRNICIALYDWHRRLLDWHWLPHRIREAAQAYVQTRAGDRDDCIPCINRSCVRRSICAGQRNIMHHLRHHRVPCLHMVQPLLHPVRAVGGAEGVWDGMRQWFRCLMVWGVMDGESGVLTRTGSCILVLLMHLGAQYGYCLGATHKSVSAAMKSCADKDGTRTDEKLSSQQSSHT